MDLVKEEQQRKEFRDILFELAKSQENLKDSDYISNIRMRLESLYSTQSPEKKFRHFYSDIFSVLTQIKQNSKLGDINILGQNLDMLRTNYICTNAENDISDSLKKLYDHVNLDIARISYSEAEDRKTSEEETVQKLQTQINSMINKLKIIEEVQKDSEEKISSQQKEYITILGIFAAVVLAFTGGIGFSTSVLNNISQASIYRTTLITLIIGLVLINILFGLFFYINKIVCKKEKFSPLIISNLIFLLLIVITIIFWTLGIVEQRDKRINNNNLTKYVIQHNAPAN